MKQYSPLVVYIGSEVGCFDDLFLIEWAMDYIHLAGDLADDPDYIELISIDYRQKFELEKAGDYLRAIIKRNWPDFDIISADSEAIAKEFFHNLLRDYLQGKCKPYEVCELVNSLESIYGVPGWLGNMYSICDQIDPQDCDYLKAEIRHLLKAG